MEHLRLKYIILIPVNVHTSSVMLMNQSSELSRIWFCCCYGYHQAQIFVLSLCSVSGAWDAGRFFSVFLVYDQFSTLSVQLWGSGCRGWGVFLHSLVPPLVVDCPCSVLVRLVISVCEILYFSNPAFILSMPSVARPWGWGFCQYFCPLPPWCVPIVDLV